MCASWSGQETDPIEVSPRLAAKKPRKTNILAETDEQLRRRRSRLWLVGLLSLPLIGAVAAFGIAPNTITEPVTLREVVDDLALEVPASEVSTDEPFWREERIQRGDTVASLLSRLQVDDAEALRFLRSSERVRPLYQLVPGRILRAVTKASGELVSLRYATSDGTELRVERTDIGFKATQRVLEMERRLVMSSGEIHSSLFAAMDSAGLGDHVATQLADIFSAEIDFNRDLRPGDRFSVVFEAFYHEGEFVRTGRIVGSEFISRGTRHRAVYFPDGAGGGYFTPEGRNLKRAFLRSPLEFSRISSGFSESRLHPVLNVWRAHRGVDYAAPTGTRVRSTADGEIIFAGHQSGYGNVVVVRHRSGYATAYGHLSGFSRGLHTGQRIGQGDVIGYVGMTGLATGPHLHYEFRVNGVHQNPLRMATPGGEPITPGRRPQFEGAVAQMLERLDLIRGMNLALVN